MRPLLTFPMTTGMALLLALPAAAQSRINPGDAQAGAQQPPAAMQQTPAEMRAQNTPPQNQQAAPSQETAGQLTAGERTIGLQKRIRQELADAGFTDIRIMPRSFMVQAKNKEGDPVMMIVNPDSVTAVTASPQSGGGAGRSAKTDVDPE